MARNSVPQMVRHPHSGQAYVSLRQPDGKRRVVYLGPHGSAEAQRRYREVLSQHLAGTLPTTATAKAPPPSDPLVSRLVYEYLLFAQQEYRDEHGKLSKHVENMTRACEHLLDVCRNRTVASITCNDLLALRAQLVADPMPNGKMRSRTYVNELVGRCKMVFRWGTTVGLVPGAVWSALSALRALGPGRGGARESEPVEAVTRAVVDAILVYLPPHLQAAVELLWWSGMRASELCNMRMRDIDRTDAVWIYQPATHKGTWKGRDRVVRLGPKCVELLRPLVVADPDAFLFSPIKVMQERLTMWRSARKSKVTPSQQQRAERGGELSERYGDQFDVPTLRRAVHRACDQAGVPRFGLHRLRHACGTRLVLQAGDDAARVQLGHTDARMVRRYSRAADAELGAAVAARHA